MAERSSNGKRSKGPATLDLMDGGPTDAAPARAPRPAPPTQAPPPAVDDHAALFGGEDVDESARHPADVPVGGYPAPSQIAQLDPTADRDDAPEASPDPFAEDDPFADTPMARMLADEPVPPAAAMRAAREELLAAPAETAQTAQKEEPPMASAPAAPAPEIESESAPEAAAPTAQSAPGLTITRRYTRPGGNVWETTEWELRTASIVGSDGTVVFEQKGVEIPRGWSQLATNVVVSKYFRGQVGTLEREYSVKQLIGRVADKILEWGRQGRYFATDADAEAFHDELRYILLHQFAAFNSPVWFNLGWAGRRQAVSACYINEVNDTMESILDLYKTEGMLFKDGSGSGVNLSTLRSSKEPLAAGGKSSGPISFMKGLDASAGSIKSGGSTRRAACMRVLDVDHPDIADFILCKKDAEEKAHALIDAGYSGAFNVVGGAYDTVPFQNANHSVRVTDDFMQAVEAGGEWQTRFRQSGKAAGTTKARDLMQSIAEATWVCGDPGMQYDTTINDWHTCSNTDRIYASNPCCVTADTLVAVADGRNAVAIKDLVGTETPVYAHDHASGRTTISRMWNIGIKRESAAVHQVNLDDGSSFRATDDHLIMLRDGSYRMVRDLQPGDSLMPFHSKVLTPEKTRTKRRYYWTGRAWKPQYRAVWEYFHGTQPDGYHIHHSDFNALNDTIENLALMAAEEHHALHGEKMRGDNNPARRLMSDEWRHNIGDSVRGAKNGNYGRTHSEETRRVMREKSEQRWAGSEERARSGAAIKAALAQAKADGRSIGRPAGERYERCCPVCRGNFTTRRVEQIFCSDACRCSPMGRQMSGEKTWAQNRGRALSAEHRSKLRVSVSAANDPDSKRRAAQKGHCSMVLKAARLLLDNDIIPSLRDWDDLRSRARLLGAARVPTAATARQHFADDAALREQAELYNHKVASVEFCGYEDVYDGTVDTHHNFAILTSAEQSCAEGALNHSGIFIHNSEYMFLNSTACNLSSLNLMKFRGGDGAFDVESFEHAVRIMLTAQEVVVGFAAYPTAKIEERSHVYRTLGLGYANLGALLMAAGLPYDSDAGRAYAGAVTALMTGRAYHQSAVIARDCGGPFAGYAENRDPMLRVMRKHREHVDHINPKLIPDTLLAAARDAWDDVLAEGQESGFRNAQATVLAPTGTIGFLMDCDTTGIEPDIAIVKYKSLVGGGTMKIVNQTVPEALQRLGYTEDEGGAIIKFIDEHDTIEGAPGLKPEHLPIFDCAFRPMNGTRSIHHMGHIQMMAAAQPFISGAISKCVTGETLICTDRGMMPIKAFYQGEKPGTFRPCATTLASISAPQSADLFYYGGIRPTVRLTLADGRTLEGTTNHRVKVANAQGYDWKRLDEITSEDFVAVRLGTEHWAEQDARIEFRPTPRRCNQKAMRLPERMSPAFGRLLGYYIAEGHMTHSTWTVCITNNNPVVLENCRQIVRDLFGLEGRVATDSRNGVTSFVVASKTLVELLDYLGCGGNSASKQMPWSILQSRRETVQEFIAGLWLDGYVRQDGMAAICLNSPTLIAQLQVALNNFGLRPQIIRKFNAAYGKHFTELGLHGNDVRKFAFLFRLDDAHKADRLRDVCARTETTNAVYSDVVPCYRNQMQAAIRAAHETMAWRHVFDKRTRFVSWETARGVCVQYGIPELAEIVENNIHFVRVKDAAEGMAEVYDFQVPENHAFIGNGIVNHNTVNVPNEASPETIADTYMQAWKLGIKAVAIYRDGSKRTQPLNTSKEVPAGEKAPAAVLPNDGALPQAVRRRLPDERASITHKFSIGGHEGYLTVGLYPDTQQPGEIFIRMAKEGSSISGLMDSFATAISLALQYGVPLSTLVDKFIHSRFEPSGFTGNKDIPMAKSVMDYIFRYLALRFLQREERQNVGLLADQEGYGEASPAPPAPRQLPLFSPTHDAKNGSLSNGNGKNGNGSGLKSGGPDNAHLADTTTATVTDHEREIYRMQSDAPPCPECGAITIRNGACYRCISCGTSLGCS